MNCANHIEVPATAYCRTCGKALCANCTKDVRGVIYCEECIAARLNDPATAQAVPPTGTSAAYTGSVTMDSGASPGWAAFLGFIPGVGAMYNGQYGKGFLHVLVFASLIWMSDHGFEVIGGIGIPAWIFYMVFDAYKTAKARKYGLPIPDPLGINNVFSSPDQKATEARYQAAAAARANMVAGSPEGVYAPEPVPVEYATASHSNIPTGAIVLIVIGMAFLLDNLGIMHFHWIGRMWPLILIVLGVSMFVRRGYFSRR